MQLFYKEKKKSQLQRACPEATTNSFEGMMHKKRSDCIKQTEKKNPKKKKKSSKGTKAKQTHHKTGTLIFKTGKHTLRRKSRKKKKKKKKSRHTACTNTHAKHEPVLKTSKHRNIHDTIAKFPNPKKIERFLRCRQSQVAC
jgi:hypothetical protein